MVAGVLVGVAALGLLAARPIDGGTTVMLLPQVEQPVVEPTTGATRPDAPSPILVVGEDNWLFTVQTFNLPCADDWPDPVAVRRQTDRLAAALARRGRPLTTMIIPEKAWMYPDELPDDVPNRACADDAVTALRTEMASAGHYVDAWAITEAAVAASAVPLYWRADTHWNDLGRLAIIPELVDSISPGIFDRRQVRVLGTVTSDGGDLGQMTPVVYSESTIDLTVDRSPGQASVDLLGDEGRVTRRRMTGVEPLIGGTTLLITDSHLYNSAEWVAPWFEDLVVLRWHIKDGVDVASLAEEADRVVLSFSGRFAGTRMEGAARELTRMLDS